MKTDTTKHRTNGRKNMNDALTTLLHTGAIATIFVLLACAGTAAGAAASEEAAA